MTVLVCHITSHIIKPIFYPSHKVAFFDKIQNIGAKPGLHDIGEPVTTAVRERSFRIPELMDKVQDFF